MIAPMQKLSILCLAAEKEANLEALRDLGVLHVTPCTAPSGATSETAHERRDRAHQALITAEAYADHAGQPSDVDIPADPDALIDTICKHRRQHRHIEEQLVNLHHKHHTLLPYGAFEPATLKSLAEQGVVVRFYHVRDLSSVDIPEHVYRHILSEDKTGTRLALVAKDDFTVDAAEFHPYDQSLSEIEADISAIQQDLERITDALHALSQARSTVEQALHEREEAVQYADVHDSIGEHGQIVYLKGFCPSEAVESVREAAARHGWGLLVEDPAPEDNVPTLLKFPRWVKPIKAVLEMLSIVPGYRESDISAIFLVFFSIFFAILIGDAGYGMLFLAVTLIARTKKPKAPAYPFILFGILSICTIIWGAITGNYFGIPPSELPVFLRGIQVEWLTGPNAQDHIMTLCFLIGAIHLTLAHLWNTIAIAPRLQAIAQIGWIGLVWCMYFTALNMVLQQPLPAVFMPMILGSVALILLFMTPLKQMKTEWIHHAMFPLSMVNCFVDIVSYIRLFAVGLASLSVAQSFNDMAFQLGWSRLWTIPIMALILLAGHGLNIILCALGILVHGVRLNTLEFSLHKNLEWKGTPYQPFARRKAIGD